nr:MAG TPA: NikA, BACTERIAL CONJUGATION, RELAXASE, DNA [Caudoviricetes sp.]
MGYKKRGEFMSPNIGRPKSENPKSNPIHVRLDDKTLAILDEYCATHRKKRTEGIRDGILLLVGK